MGPLDVTDEEEAEYRRAEDREQCELRFSALGPVEDYGGCLVYNAVYDDGEDRYEYEVDEARYRIIDQYEAARRRQGEALALAERRWNKPVAPPPSSPPAPPEPAPEAIPPAGRLTARQALFCEHYAAQPVAARAAVLAGYSEGSADNQGYRLLKNPLVLTEIAALRAERKLRYVIEADTMQDKLEAVFFEALGDRNHAAAVSALRLQAGLARLPTRPAASAAAEDAADTEPDAAKGAVPRRRRTRKDDKKRSGRRKKTRKDEQRR